MWSEIENAIETATGESFICSGKKALSGGCIHQAVCLSGGARRYFVKFNEAALHSVFETEAIALEVLDRTHTLRVPKVVCRGVANGRAWLVLEYIQLQQAQPQSQAQLGRQLGRLHRLQPGFYGWTQDDTIGRTPQKNPRSADWIEFYREHRLLFQFRLARSRGARFAGADPLLDRLGEFFSGYTPRPSILHGDLWSGNVGFTREGAPVVYDPALFYGDHEYEFGIIDLFGGFDRAFFDAYRSVFPLNAGFEMRLPLYRLYHELNHFNLFGGGYAGACRATIQHLLRSI